MTDLHAPRVQRVASIAESEPLHSAWDAGIKSDQEQPMDFRFTPEQERFRTEVRDFVAREWGERAATSTLQGADDEEWERQLAFRKALARHGWLTRAWPT